MTSIGIFDSGVGGLTVLRALLQALPKESFSYLGDTARLPYGSKSPETIRRYLDQNLHFLKALDVKAVIVACNSASAALSEDHWNGVPVYGVIRPGAQAAARATKNGRVGVLGTRATVQSGAYVQALKSVDLHIEVFQQACPLLVPLVEEGWDQDPVTRMVLQRYLDGLQDKDVDTLVLGCTHYPVLKSLIQELAGPKVQLVDSALIMAHRIKSDLEAGRIPTTNTPQFTRIWTTDISDSFMNVGRGILKPTAIDEWLPADIK